MGCYYVPAFFASLAALVLGTFAINKFDSYKTQQAEQKFKISYEELDANKRFVDAGVAAYYTASQGSDNQNNIGYAFLYTAQNLQNNYATLVSPYDAEPDKLGWWERRLYKRIAEDLDYYKKCCDPNSQLEEVFKNIQKQLGNPATTPLFL